MKACGKWRCGSPNPDLGSGLQARYALHSKWVALRAHPVATGKAETCLIQEITCQLYRTNSVRGTVTEIRKRIQEIGLRSMFEIANGFSVLL
jgi:hypothetical protein